jgi:hypothetical protein
MLILSLMVIYMLILMLILKANIKVNPNAYIRGLADIVIL